MWLRDTRHSTFSRIRVLLVVVALLFTASRLTAQTIEDLEAAFDSPPADARPWVFWYWMHGAVSPEGITADLEAMRDAGLGGAYLMPIQGPTSPPAYEPPATQLSPRFWQMIRHAAREADRLGLQLGMHLCDGFATAGGPWITPELSMQKVVWSRAKITGGRLVDIELPQPETREGYYRDIATLALPCPVDYGVDCASQPPNVTTSDGEQNAGRLARPDNPERYRSDKACCIRYDFEKAFTTRSVTITPDGSNYQCQRLRVETLGDDGSWRLVAQLDAPRHGWQDEGRPVTHALPETTSQSFRFSWKSDGSELGAEDLDSAKWAPVLKVQSIVLSSEARIHQHRGKAGEVWRQSPATTDAQAPAKSCVPLDSIIDLSKHVDDAGRLRWNAPQGEWLVMRFGHTSTGKRNATAGGGIGLECDKLSGRATRLQYDRWFGEARRQIADEIGAAAMRRTLTTLHLDSWECGAQNWTPDFDEQYHERHGEDLTKWLPAIAGYPIESAAASERFLHNVRATIADLLSRRFYGSLREIADLERLRFSGECTAPTMPSDGLRHFAYLDAPMGEFWLDSPTHDKPTDMLDAISAAHVYGKRVIQAEAFTQLRIGWDETPASLKRLGDRNLALGANRLVLHVWTHNPWLDRKPGQTLGGVGLYFQRDQPWIRGARGWMDYLARCHAVLQAGEPIVDVAVEMNSDYPRRALTPDKLVDRLPGLMGVGAVGREIRRLFNEGQPQREQPAGVRASANIPDPGDWLDPLRGYKYDSVPPELINASRYAFTHRTNGPPWTESDLTPRGVERDFESIDGVAWNHRQGYGWDAYFVSNQQDTQRRLDLSLRATGETVEVWDPNTGVRRQVVASSAGRTQLALELAPGQSQFIVLRKRSVAPRLNKPTKLAAISGPWQVAFASAVGQTPTARTLGELGDLTAQDDLRDFVGEVRYETTFDLETAPMGKPVWLEVGGAAALAEVQVNGIDCGVAWTAPWQVDVSHALRTGENQLVIVTPSTWKNRLAAEQELPEAERAAWTSAPVRLANNNLTHLGLLGPVQLLIEQPATEE
jgi:hypothetical protein